MARRYKNGRAALGGIFNEVASEKWNERIAAVRVLDEGLVTIAVGRRGGANLSDSRASERRDDSNDYLLHLWCSEGIVTTGKVGLLAETETSHRSVFEAGG